MQRVRLVVAEQLTSIQVTSPAAINKTRINFAKYLLAIYDTSTLIDEALEFEKFKHHCPEKVYYPFLN